LTIVWTTGPSGSAVVHYADRASASDPFGAASTVPPSSGPFLSGQVGVSQDGLRLAFVTSAPNGFAVITRTASGAPFSAAPTAGEFADIDATITGGETVVEVGDPVFGAHDLTFYYSLYGSGLQFTALESMRATSASVWPGGAAFGGATLEASGSARRHPTGIAADDLTLFYWDDVTSSEKMAWRPSSSSTSVSSTVDIGARSGAAPNTACTAIYYSGTGTGGTDLFVANAL
jgi:hypothetical protein